MSFARRTIIEFDASYHNLAILLKYSHRKACVRSVVNLFLDAIFKADLVSKLFIQIKKEHFNGNNIYSDFILISIGKIHFQKYEQW